MLGTQVRSAVRFPVGERLRAHRPARFPWEAAALSSILALPAAAWAQVPAATAPAPALAPSPSPSPASEPSPAKAPESAPESAPEPAPAVSTDGPGARTLSPGERSQEPVTAPLNPPRAGQPPPPTLVRSRIDVSGILRHTELLPTSGSSVQFSHLGGGGAVRAALYLRPLANDDSSPSLQPFLQRATSFYLGVSGDGFGISYSAGGQTLARRDYAGAAAHVGADVYAGRLACFGVRAGFAYSSLRDYDSSQMASAQATRTWFLPASLWVGLRLSDTLISASYAFAVRFDDQRRVDLPSWGTAELGVRTVLERQVDLTFAAWLMTRGAGVSADIGHYVSPRLGLLAGLYYRYGVLFLEDREPRHDTGGSLGLVYWFTGRVGTVLYGSAHWTSARSSGGIPSAELLASATLSLRL